MVGRPEFECRYRKLSAIVLALVIPWVCGCAMCSDCMDDRFAAYGGVRDRTDDRVHGRVGSIFDPAAALGPSTPPLEDASAALPDPAELDDESTGDSSKKDGTSGDESDGESGSDGNLPDELDDAIRKLQDQLPDTDGDTDVPDTTNIPDQET